MLSALFLISYCSLSFNEEHCLPPPNYRQLYTLLLLAASRRRSRRATTTTSTTWQEEETRSYKPLSVSFRLCRSRRVVVARFELFGQQLLSTWARRNGNRIPLGRPDNFHRRLSVCRRFCTKHIDSLKDQQLYCCSHLFCCSIEQVCQLLPRRDGRCLSNRKQNGLLVGGFSILISQR